MKNQLVFLTVTLILITTIFISNVFANQDLSLRVDKIKPNVVRVANATEAVYSPSGKFLAIQTASKFFLLPSQNLSKSTVNLQESRSWNGKILGFLPSETLIFSNSDGIFSLEPTNLKSQKISSQNVAKLLHDKELTQKGFVIVSNDLIISGDGAYDWGAEKGNIFKFDLKRKRFSKGTKIFAFWYASASPSGKHILYEHGAEDNNNTDLYDISQDKNYPISEYFNFKKEFPEYKVTDESPIAWVESDKFLAEISDNQFDENEASNSGGAEKKHFWLVLFDVTGKNVVWKKSVDKWLFPTAFQQLSENKALVNYEDEVYELSLIDGKMVKLPGIDGNSISVSPNKKRVAFLKSNQLFITSPNGSDKKLVLGFPEDWEHQTAYKGMGERSALWSADSNSLILFGNNQLFLIQL